jgi:ABC-type phosphate transport system permease subunit
VVRFLNDVLLSAPSILVGLFVYELLVRAVSRAFRATRVRQRWRSSQRRS